MAALLQEQWGLGQPEFGAGARRLHESVNGIPARLGAAMFSLAAPFLSFARLSALLQAPVAAIAEKTAAAAALGVSAEMLALSLGGTLSPYSERWLGGGTREPGARDVTRAVAAYGLSVLLALLALAALAY